MQAIQELCSKKLMVDNSLPLSHSLSPLSLLVFPSSHVYIFHYHLNLIVYLHPMCLLR